MVLITTGKSNFIVYKVLLKQSLVYLIVDGCFHSTVIVLSSCKRDYMAYFAIGRSKKP